MKQARICNRSASGLPPIYLFSNYHTSAMASLRSVALSAARQVASRPRIATAAPVRALSTSRVNRSDALFVHRDTDYKWVLHLLDEWL